MGTDMSDDGVERECAVAAAHLDEHTEEQTTSRSISQ
jgi:hypothetical protein